MSINNQEIIDDLGEIIQLLADVWPNDRDNVAEAGAKFEKVISSYNTSLGQLQKLSELAWNGLKHLYQNDDFFMTVKSGTMQAINMFREYILSDGDVTIENFEKSYQELEKALEGAGESADTVIELTEEQIAEYQKQTEAEEEEKETTSEEQSSAVEESSIPSEVTLDDVASFIMMVDEDSFSDEQHSELASLLTHCISSVPEPVSGPLNDALGILTNDSKSEGWLQQVSTKIELATNVEENLAYAEQETVAPAVVEETPSVEEEVVAESVEEEVAETEEYAEEKVTASEVFYIPDDVELDMVGEFITECTELIEAAESALLDLEDNPNDMELVNTIFRAFHTIKGTSAFMGLQPITEFTHWVETVLSIVRDGDLPFDQACADINFESIDIIKNLLSVVEVSKGGDPLHVPEKFDKMMVVLVDVSDHDVKPADAMAKVFGDSGMPAPSASESTTEEDTEEVVKKATPRVELAEVMEESTTNNVGAPKSEDASVRVSVNRLDRLIDMVGELVIAHSVVAQDQGIPKDSELQKKVNHTTKILRELQDSSLTLRMVPLKATFHKMNRLVRDVSKKAGKNVKFTTFGEDTEIDRNMVDVINEPLIHMLRNSIDHGLETPDERAGTEKSEVGNITLSAYQEGGKVVIKIVDDGRGINKDVIFKKAVEKGLIDPDKKLTDQEIYGLIFLPGFSSAEVVTDLSGRGVGMDVVRRSIEQLQGKVEVDSELGVGTTITIELPFTLAITDGMLIRVGQQRFIVPTINIDMTFRAEVDDLFTVLGESEQVSFRGKSVPVIRLHKLFEIPGAIEDVLTGTLLVIKNNNDRYAMLVDEVIGQQQLVGKSINMINSDHISGGAILGDGQVGLILDTAALTEAA